MRLFLSFGADTMAKEVERVDQFEWLFNIREAANADRTPVFPFKTGRGAKRRKVVRGKISNFDMVSLRRMSIRELKQWISQWNPRHHTHNAVQLAHVMNNLNWKYRSMGYALGEEPYRLPGAHATGWRMSKEWWEKWKKIPKEFTPAGRPDLTVWPLGVDYYGQVLSYEVSERPGAFSDNGNFHDYYLYPLFKTRHIITYIDFYGPDGEEE